MNYYLLELNGKEVKFRLTSADSMELEKKTGKKLFDLLQDYSVTTIVTLLRYMRKSELPNFSEKDACSLYDELIDGGYTLEDIIFKILYETAVVSGFLKKEELEEIVEEVQTRKLEKKEEIREE